MTRKETYKKELLAINSRMLKALHDVYRYDYNAPYAINKHCGKFTVKSLIKNGFIPENVYDYQVVILVQRPFVRVVNSLYSVKVTRSGEFSTEITGRYSEGLDKYWRKLDFNDDRKYEETTIYIVIQHNEYLTPTKKLEDRPTERVKLIYCPTESDHLKYKLFCNYGEGKHDKNWNFHWVDEKEIGVSVDKSGYYLQSVRRKLQERASELRARREKESYFLIDNTAKIEEQKNALNFIRDTIKKRVELAETAENWEKIADVMNGYWSSFPRALKLMEDLERKEKAKEYRNQKNFENNLEEIKDSCTAICKKLFAD